MPQFHTANNTEFDSIDDLRNMTTSRSGNEKKKKFHMPNFEQKKLVFLQIKQNNTAYHDGRASSVCGNPKKCKTIITMLVDYNYQTNSSNSQVFLYVTKLIT